MHKANTTLHKKAKHLPCEDPPPICRQGEVIPQTYPNIFCPHNVIKTRTDRLTRSSHTVTHQLLAVVVLWVRVKRILGTGVAVMLLWGIQRQGRLVPAWGVEEEHRMFSLWQHSASADIRHVLDLRWEIYKCESVTPTKSSFEQRRKNS